ncbi:hypothetical protein BpHYR1_025574 [Brachionus plicatilis]|uniref:Uncharacterized protein n=1 Tax=Brachionus plicatilis TaxID=10195 RepID=A0A3M7PHZ3_BRAPC|nr:hypothetical protein BpHYR1_025574 [Brachionus plicatilis]
MEPVYQPYIYLKKFGYWDMNKTLKFKNDELKKQVLNFNLDSNDFTVELNNQITAHHNHIHPVNILHSTAGIDQIYRSLNLV